MIELLYLSERGPGKHLGAVAPIPYVGQAEYLYSELTKKYEISNKKENSFTMSRNTSL